MVFLYEHFVAVVIAGMTALGALCLLLSCAAVIRGYKRMLWRRAEADHRARLAEDQARRLRERAEREQGDDPDVPSLLRRDRQGADAPDKVEVEPLVRSERSDSPGADAATAHAEPDAEPVGA